MAKANGKLPQADLERIDKWVEKYIALRTRMKELKEYYEAYMKPYEEAKQQLAGHMLEILDQAGIESARTEQGTVYISPRSTASLSDPDAFMEFVAENNLYELLDRRANSVACREFAAERGELPPGVKLNTVRTIGVRA